jgi:hypothetical protein
MSVVRPEFGPTLAEVVAPRVRALPRAGRLAFWALVAVLAVLVVLAALRLARGDDRAHAIVREPVAYNLVYGEGLARVAPRGRETLRLQTPAGAAAPQSFAVTPMRVAPYEGDVTAALMGLSPNMIERMRSELPGFVWRGDGRVNINKQPGYEIIYQYRRDGRTTYGRRIMLVPDPDTDGAPREGVDITLLATRSPAVPRVDAVGTEGQLRTALRSLRFGTERP